MCNAGYKIIDKPYSTRNAINIKFILLHFWSISNIVVKHGAIFTVICFTWALLILIIM